MQGDGMSGFGGDMSVFAWRVWNASVRARSQGVERVCGHAYLARGGGTSQRRAKTVVNKGFSG